MTEEVKKEEGAQKVKKIISTLLKVVLGIVFLVLGVLAILRWWRLLLMIIKGCLGLFLILAGIITLAIAKE